MTTLLNDTDFLSVLLSMKTIVRLFEDRSNDEKAYERVDHLIQTLQSHSANIIETHKASFESAISHLVAAKNNRFWVSICDVLEYDIQPIYLDMFKY